MRIISQDGKFDLPYEAIYLERVGNDIFAALPDNRSILVGSYTSSEKADVVMKMCAIYYSDYETTINNGDYNIYVRPKVFDFPKDSEVKL